MIACEKLLVLVAPILHPKEVSGETGNSVIL